MKDSIAYELAFYALCAHGSYLLAALCFISCIYAGAKEKL